MIARIKRSIVGLFLGEPIAESERVYLSEDGRFELRLSLFRSRPEDTMWLKFFHRSLLMRVTNRIGIAVDSFQDFARFLGESLRKPEGHEEEGQRVPFLLRAILFFSEGASQVALLGEYRPSQGSKTVIRLFSFKNRRQKSRVLFQVKSPWDESHEIFDAHVLALLERKVATKAMHDA